MSPEALEGRLSADIDALRRRGFGAEADRLKLLLVELTASIDPIRLVDEPSALLRTGRSRRWLRDRFDGWQRASAAEMRDGERYYRLCVPPTRPGL